MNLGLLLSPASLKLSFLQGVQGHVCEGHIMLRMTNVMGQKLQSAKAMAIRLVHRLAGLTEDVHIGLF